MAFENQQNLDLNDQGGRDVPSRGGGKLGCAITGMGPLLLDRKCEYRMNAGHITSMPVSRQKNEMAFDSQQDLDLDDQGGRI
jgi:hypothetical protein